MNFPILSSLILLPTIGAFFYFSKSNKENNITVNMSLYSLPCKFFFIYLLMDII